MFCAMQREKWIEITETERRGWMLCEAMTTDKPNQKSNAETINSAISQDVYSGVIFVCNICLMQKCILSP